MNFEKCENCLSLHEGSFGSGRFCSEKCCRSFSTKAKRMEINKKVSEKLKGKPIIGRNNKINFWKKPENKERSLERSRKISEKLKRNWIEKNNVKNYEDFKLPIRRRILWNEQGEKCNVCGYNLLDTDTGPYQIHHIDGNKENKSRENEELLCYNCHYVTNNFGFKNKKHTKETRDRISAGLRAYYKNKKARG